MGEAIRRYSGKRLLMGKRPKNKIPRAKVAARTSSHKGVKVTAIKAIERIPTLVPVRCGTRHS